MTNYRSTTQIMADVLSIASEESIPITRLCTKSNLSHSRLKKLLGNLTSSGLMNISFKKNVAITDKGRLYLAEYKKFHDVAESFGLEI